ncbi:MAG: hypothetical protein IJB02_05400 [Oscillospiraceae bacterium]|nr:hypothetical protein [Oscillospiraceae bacterium]
MADTQNFRTAFRGFHRQDVVQYIEMINNRHNAQVAQLNTQLQTAREELAQFTAAPAQDNGLQAQLDAALARIEELEAQLASAPVKTNDELEAYRRAERAERLAKERAEQLTAQINGVLAEATTRMESVSDELTDAVDNLSAKLATSKQELRSAVDALYAIRPQED